MMSWGVLVDEPQKCSTNVCFHVGTIWWIEPCYFLLQFLLAGGGHVNLIFLLKLLSLSALLYAGTALPKCSLPQDISDILMLTIDSIIILVIAGGCFDCKVK